MRLLKTCTASLFGLILLLNPSNSFADNLNEIERLLDVAGTKTQVALVAAKISTTLSTGNTEGINIHNILENIRTALAEQLTEPDVATLMSWHKTELGKKIIALDLAAGGFEQVNRPSQNLSPKPPSPERTEMTREIYNALGGVESARLTMQSMQLTVFNAEMPNATEEERQRTIAQIDEQIDAQLPKVREQALATSLSTYSSLSDAEYRTYVDFLSSPAARKFYPTTTSALGRAIGEEMGMLILRVNKKFIPPRSN